VNNGKIENCYTTGNVSGENKRIGGVVGLNDGTVQNCFATGKISGNDEVGGVAGYVNNNKEIKNCVALNLMVTAKVNLSSDVNRVIGFCYSLTNVSNNYARDNMNVKYNWGGSTGYKKRH